MPVEKHTRRKSPTFPHFSQLLPLAGHGLPFLWAAYPHFPHFCSLLCVWLLGGWPDSLATRTQTPIVRIVLYWMIIGSRSAESGFCLSSRFTLSADIQGIFQCQFPFSQGVSFECPYMRCPLSSEQQKSHNNNNNNNNENIYCLTSSHIRLSGLHTIIIIQYSTNNKTKLIMCEFKNESKSSLNVINKTSS